MTDIDRLKEIIEEARLKGYATAFEEVYHADASIAAPILGAQGEMIGSVSLALSTLRYTAEQLETSFAPMILAAARSISFA